MDDAQYVLMKDTQEKKQTAHSASKRVGRTSKVTFPYEMMRGKDRKKYMESSEVVTFKLEPMSLKEFRDVPADKKIELLKWYGEKYGWNAAGIAAGLDANYTTGQKLLQEYMLTAMFKARMKECSKEQKDKFMENRKELEKQRSEAAQEVEQVDHQLTQPTEKKPPQAITATPTSSFGIELHCTKVGHQLGRQLEGIARSLGMGERYVINLSIVEIPSYEEQSVSDVPDA